MIIFFFMKRNICYLEAVESIKVISYLFLFFVLFSRENANECVCVCVYEFLCVPVFCVHMFCVSV